MILTHWIVSSPAGTRCNLVLDRVVSCEFSYGGAVMSLCGNAGDFMVRAKVNLR